MPATAVLLDTSVAVALLLEGHEAHADCIEALRGKELRGKELGLAGHALFETLSVMSRLPGSARRPVADVYAAIQFSFPATVFLTDQGAIRTAQQIAQLGISGGSVYDALVAAVAVERKQALLTRDMRALTVYQLMGAPIMVLQQFGATN